MGLQMTISDMFQMAEGSLNGRKHMQEKEKFLVMSNFSFPTIFSKDLYCRHLETRACLGKGKSEYEIIMSVVEKLEKWWFTLFCPFPIIYPLQSCFSQG